MRKDNQMSAEQTADQPVSTPRPGERVQRWWCVDCELWHEGSVLGGPVVGHGDDKERD